MNEVMYSIHSGYIAVVLLLSLLVAMEIGVRLGHRTQASANEATKQHVNAVQSSILGILALLLAFALSLSLQRFDARSEAVVSEANAIGTTYLRAQLLKPPLRAEVQAQLRDYVDLRVRAGSLALVEGAERDALLADAARAQNALWASAMRSAEVDPSLLTSGLFIQALNELIDSLGRRDAALHRHVPELVLLLMYGTFLMAGGIVGFACGVGGHRPSLASYVMVLLIVVLVFIIVDLDRPRRGLIQVSQKSLLDLQASMRASAAATR